MTATKVYNRINDMPKETIIQGRVFRLGDKVVYDCKDSIHHGKTGEVVSIQYAPLDDWYYQRIEVKTGIYGSIESSSRFWLPDNES